jgi:dCMP deaminase
MTTNNKTFKRPSREATLFAIANEVGKRGTCRRAQVGAVIARSGRVISTGYNGPSPAEPPCTPPLCDISKPCTRAIHAEANAIYFAARHGVSLNGAALYVTYSPCVKCCEAIVQSGIAEVHYLKEFRETDHLDLLRASGIIVKQHTLDDDYLQNH